MLKKILISLILLFSILPNGYAALVKGVSCGFVLAAPVVDPLGSSRMADNRYWGMKDTSAADATTVTELGWYCDNATEAANFDVGLYSHDATNNKPNALVGSISTAAKGTDAGWKLVSGLSISISGTTIYWIAFELDSTATDTNANRTATVGLGDRYSTLTVVTALPDPTWSASSTEVDDFLFGIYAVYTVSGGETPTQMADVFGFVDGICNTDCFGQVM